MWNRQNKKSAMSIGHRDLRLRRAVVGMFALVWWGILYPELCFTEDTYAQVAIVEGEEVVVEQPDIRGFLGASEDEIVVRSRFLEWLEERMTR